MNWWKTPILMLVALLLGGCTLLPEREPVDRAWYLLELPDEPAARTADEPVAVELGSVRVAPAYAGNGLVYRLGNHQYESDYYNEWFLRPSEQVEQLLRERWTRSGAAIELVDNAAAVREQGRPAIRVHVLITALYGDLDGANGIESNGLAASGTGHMGLRAQLSQGERSRLVHLESEQPLERRSASQLVGALSRATAEVLVDLEDAILEEVGGMDDD
ncbi:MULTISPECIES: ABC-type transport auxiliary lipoprotein family protein [unclassified Thioalkalivibrio]|uniref:ABC-type transport auxiliary lipoprotein family protein n=1 Tax=unclassified Thioalkalivibrio TaxID=2621013 RepID=UPI00037FDAAA|nr:MULTISPECIES: ABC-type transport auxiliary lipoprotein family protein [unclassified Thioalkalivibrio]